MEIADHVQRCAAVYFGLHMFAVFSRASTQFRIYLPSLCAMLDLNAAEIELLSSGEDL